MKIATKVVVYVIENRRTIGLIVGGLLTLLGMEDVINGPMA